MEDVFLEPKTKKNKRTREEKKQNKAYVNKCLKEGRFLELYSVVDPKKHNLILRYVKIFEKAQAKAELKQDKIQEKIYILQKELQELKLKEAEQNKIQKKRKKFN